jgi:two-component system sensor histidine kinase KdpD
MGSWHRDEADSDTVHALSRRLEDIIKHAVADVGPRSIMVRVPARLPEVMADPELMERVIVNLARNALRYSPPGTPTLLTAHARGRLELRVIDRWLGIPTTERDRAFLPFQRAAA